MHSLITCWYETETDIGKLFRADNGIRRYQHREGIAHACEANGWAVVFP